ncbi:sulfite exporter TauE/SafE family protein [Mucilaginibacter ginkgonis]|uniref:Sulfite exporter TauE/SafE family protein n=1 Tax=Mucilaginibacter ginkgonis TaxID=2682091 RepID=A0A6I4IMI6_9SPHI|nr:sulfite exporter TauE/SafE family protein [Mucilaginibacter ginkgonis]QQL50250.1 sulfite exporter TauE/SafE family protein [Mucilaginibacter ginkgonis]
MDNNQIAFYIGLFGSVHCIGMCGPLVFAVSCFHRNWWRVIFDKLVYNFGRICSYTFLGLLIGFIGKQLWLAGLQQSVSVISGLLIIIAGLLRMFKFKVTQTRLMPSLLNPMHMMLHYALNHRAGHFPIGLLNGFLPCGFVYLALIGAVNTNSPWASAHYMFWFGMGTFPLMLIAMVSAGYIGPIFRRSINKAMPYLLVCLGVWFVLRGLNLDIPYLSPPKPVSGVALCH